MSATIVHAVGALRKAAQALLRGDGGAAGHYTGADGGSGRMYVMLDAAGGVQGACLVGKTASASAERSLVAAPWKVVAIKRLYCTDTAPLPESALLRAAIADVANQEGQTLMVVSYADPAAQDTRTGLPLLGGCLAGAGMLMAGHTTSQRWGLVDERGIARSSRQGAITLSAGNLPPGWRRVKLPPARIWLTVVAPTVITRNGTPHPTSVRWRKHQRRQCWAALNPARRVAALQWVEHRHWRRLRAARQVVPLGPSTSLRWPNERRPAWWHGADLGNRAAPVWVPETIQLGLASVVIDHAAALTEQTAGRAYLPRAAVIAVGRPA